MDRALRRGRFKTGDLTPEEVVQFMDGTAEDSASDDDLIYSDDDDGSDADYDPRLDEISPEDDIAIDQHLEAVGNDTSMLANAINISLDLSMSDLPAASSTIHPILSLSHEEEVETTEPQPSTSAAVGSSLVRPAKRLRSPLPSMEATGPSVRPSHGGFTGSGE